MDDRRAAVEARVIADWARLEGFEVGPWIVTWWQIQALPVVAGSPPAQ